MIYISKHYELWWLCELNELIWKEKAKWALCLMLFFNNIQLIYLLSISKYPKQATYRNIYVVI